MGTLTEMLDLQERMNQKVNPEWRTAGYSWLRAASLEAAEAMDHWGWKWWKKQTPDLEQFKIELVDIWHFLLSEAIVQCGEDAEEELNSPEYAERYVDNPCDSLYVYVYADPEVDTVLDAQGRLDLLIGLCALKAPLNDIVSVFHAIREIDAKMSIEDLHRSYLAKNVLNFFRQDNGYKEGTYQKEWFGEEDNVWLQRLVSALPEPTEKLLYASLKASYAKAVEYATKGD